MAYVQIHRSVETAPNPPEPTWSFCFQLVTYHYDDGAPEPGYRFIWRRPSGQLQGARGQARIPNLATMHLLLGKAAQEGWLSDDPGAAIRRLKLASSSTPPLASEPSASHRAIV